MFKFDASTMAGITLVFMTITSPAPITADLNANPACGISKMYADLHWNELKQGTILGGGDAIFTCRGSTVTIRANLPLDLPSGSPVRWHVKKKGYVGTIPPQSTLVIPEQPEKASRKLEVEVVKIEGAALSSIDRALIKERGGSSIRTLTPEEKRQRDREEELQLMALKAIGWEPLTLDRQLGPWDMIWTKRDGRVEIEILKEGKYPIRDSETDVRDASGQLTRRKIFPAHSFFIMYPEYYQSARVNKIIGDVVMATNMEKVKHFYRRFHVISDSKWAEMPEGAYERYKEMLEKGDLE